MSIATRKRMAKQHSLSSIEIAPTLPGFPPRPPLPVKPATSATSPRRQSAARTATAGLIGNVVEWFDFAVYGFFVGAIGKQFFPTDSPLAQDLAALAGFAVGFVGRPIGSIVLGLVGDRIGRRALLTLSIALMGGATLLLGLLPTHAQIGVAAPILLVFLRLVQGFSVGGELTGSMVYTAEQAAAPRRGLIASSTAAGTSLGILLGNLAAVIVHSTLDKGQVAAWGWRIPFLASVLLCVAGWAVRRDLDESEIGREAAARRPPILPSLLADWLPMLRTFGIVAMTNAAYYLTFTFAAERRAVAGGGGIFWAANLVAMVMLLAMKPLGGWLSDRIGRRSLMMALTVIGMSAMALALPLLLAGSPSEFLSGQIIVAVPVGMSLGLQGAMLVEIFPVRTRVTSMSFAYGASMLIAGATTPMVSTWLIDVVGQPTGPAYYVMVYGAIGLLLMWPMNETNGSRLDD